MLQIFGLRPFTKKSGEESAKAVFYDKGWQALSHTELFGDLANFLKLIPKEERYNIFYTLNHALPGKARQFEKMTAIAFDIDKIASFDPTMALGIAGHVCEVVNQKLSDATVVVSGHGVHVIFELKPELHSLDPEIFVNLRQHYKYTCQKIGDALLKAGFAGAKADTGIFDKARFLRLPGTENRKKDMEPVPCTLVQVGKSQVDLDITKTSGVADLQPEESMAVQTLNAYPPPDTDAVLTGCAFLVHCKENQKDVSEPEWYASLSILGRVSKNAAKALQIAHDYSKFHPTYDPGATDLKVEQALLSGPRTCQSIHDTWTNSKCRQCPHWGKIASPILIHGEDYIKTAETGFYQMLPDPQTGKLKVGPPQYEDLRKFFERETKYFVAIDTEAVYRWAGKHWEEMPEIEIKAFAHKHFNPKPRNHVVNEFIGFVKRNKLKPYSWFRDTTFKKMNFENGVLDLEDMSFSEHSPKFGFRKVLPYSYDPGALAPRFSQFMQETMRGRQELVDILLEFMGYSLSNDVCWEQKAVVLLGTGANGKSTFVNTLKKLAGDGAYSSVNIADLENPANRYHLDGAAFNISEETPSKSLADSSLFKNLVSGGEIVVKKLFVQPYTILSRAKMWLLCNEMPRTYDSSYGMFRRIVIVPFQATFTEENKDIYIEDKLGSELPGILNMALSAYVRMRSQRGLTKSKIVQAAVEQYKLDSDICLNWWKNNMEVFSEWSVDSDNYELQQDIYDEFRAAMERGGEKFIPSLVQFFRRVNMSDESLYHRRLRRRVDGKGLSRVLMGVKLDTKESEKY